VRTSQIFALATVTLLPLAATAQHKYVDIEADSSTMADQGAAIVSNNATYTLAVKHDVGVNVFYPTLQTSDHPLPGHTKDFRFYMSAHPGTTTPGEKMLINVVKTTDSFVAAWNQTNTIGFEVRLGPGYQIQSKNMQLSEWWQGSPYGAIVELILLPGTKQWALDIENDHNNSQHGAPGPVIVIPGNTLTVGRWYKFEIAVTPSYATNGTVQVWQDDKLVVDSHDHPVGYEPGHPVVEGGNGGKPMNTFDVEVGMYRPANTANAEIFFDSIRWGDTHADIK
jgi:hypothetical protein